MDLTLILSYFPIIFVLYFSLKTTHRYHLAQVSNILILLFNYFLIYLLYGKHFY